MDSQGSDNHYSRLTTADESEASFRNHSGRRRGRGRGGTRGIGRGCRGRGMVNLAPVNRVVVVEQTRETRIAQLEERIDSMTEEDLRASFKEMCRSQPSYVLNISDKCRVENGPQPDRQTHNPPAWCVCTYCREMPTEQERLCCNRVPQNCHSRLPDFHNIAFDELTLEVAIRYRNDFLAQPNDDDYNRCHRHAAYRQYMLWIHGHLGAGNRRVIPSCCVWRIRDKHPDQTGQYVGLVGGRLG